MIGKRFGSLVMCGLLLALGACHRSGSVPAPPGAPNMLIIVADDLTWSDLGATGSPDAKTPNIDRLAREGMQLQGMFSPAPMCSPARHALYTGLYPVRSGGYPNHSQVQKGTHSLFTYLRDAGYRVGLLGKVHVHPKSSYPFERIGKDADDLRAFERFVSKEPTRPWLVVFASHDPHAPWNRGPKGLYDPAKLTVPPYLHDTAVTRGALAAYFAEISQLDAQVGELLRILSATGQEQDTIVLFVSEQGSSFPFGGKWLLYDTGIRSAAFVRWPGKVRPGSKSKALMQYVDVAPTLLAAAGIDTAGIDTGPPDADGQRGFDGRSFLEVLLGRSDHHRDYVFAVQTTVGMNDYKDPYPVRAARDDRYKLIRNLAPQNTFGTGDLLQSDVWLSWQLDAASRPALSARLESLSHRPAEELYDLQADPFELVNLAAHQDLTATRDRLRGELDAWMRQQGDRGLSTEMAAESHQR